MKIIGITGGVGAGKSTVLNYIKQHYNCIIYLTDEVAHTLQEPGNICYNKIVKLVGKEVLNSDLTINRKELASIIFDNKHILDEINNIVHPEVMDYILKEAETNKESSKYDFMFIESALLIRAGYKDVVDETWYIDAATDIRRERLKKNRGYSDFKVDTIFKAQLKDEETKYKCDYIIFNNNDFSDTVKEVDRLLM